MKTLFFAATGLSVIVLAFWAYQGNYKTQESLSHVRALQSEITALRQAISVQRAEWAYLNRPDRLGELADLNFDKLNLLPLDPGQFAEVSSIPYPPPELPATDIPNDAITNPVDVSASLPAAGETP